MIVRMPTKKSSLSVLDLERQIIDVREEIAAKLPLQMRKLKSLEELLSIRREEAAATVDAKDFSIAANHSHAITLLFAAFPEPMTKQLVLDRLTAGGYIKDDDTKWTVNDTLNYMLRTKKLLRKGPEKRMQTVVQMPSAK